MIITEKSPGFPGGTTSKLKTHNSKLFFVFHSNNPRADRTDNAGQRCQIGGRISLRELDMSCIGRNLTKGRINRQPVADVAFGPAMVEEAIGCFEASLKVEPNGGMACLALATVYFELQRYPEAERLGMRAAKLGESIGEDVVRRARERLR